MWSTFDIFFLFFVESRLTHCLKRNFQQHRNLRHVNFSLWGFKPGPPEAHCAGVSSSAGGWGWRGRGSAQYGPRPLRLVSGAFLSSPPQPRSFTWAIFRAVFDSRSSLFVPTPHGNAFYAGYTKRINRHEILILGHYFGQEPIKLMVSCFGCWKEYLYKRHKEELKLTKLF